MRDGRRELLTVGQACRYVGVSRMTLLAAEDAGLLAPARTPGGHRRYEVLDLDRLLVRRGAAMADPPPPSTAQDREHPDPVVAEALRQLVLVLRVDAAALYEVGDALVLRRSYGLPRWLTDQLAQRPAPAPVLQALASGREAHFEAADCFPRPSSGAGVAVAVPGGDQPLGVLAVLAGRGRSFLGGELDIIRATATCLSLMLEQQRLVDALSERLREVHRLSTTTTTTTTTKETIHA